MKCRECDKDVLVVPLPGQKNPDGITKTFEFAYCKETVHAILNDCFNPDSYTCRVQK
jgi:hypothetical protein